jgi:probable rRNA maturation factor
MSRAGPSEVRINGDADGLDRAMRAATMHVLRGERQRAQIAITFVGKTRMRRLNAAHLGHNEATDVISFPLRQPDGSVAADIYICRYRAARNARIHAVHTRDELARLVVHGTLHVLGWDHPAGTARTRSPMWRRQEQYVASLR